MHIRHYYTYMFIIIIKKVKGYTGLRYYREGTNKTRGFMRVSIVYYIYRVYPPLLVSTGGFEVSLGMVNP